MITEFRAQNYGCLKDVTARLTPLHAFIGPNDSGKSTLLRGLRTVVHLAADVFHPTGNAAGQWRPFDPGLPEQSLVSATTKLGTYTVRGTGKNSVQEVSRKIVEEISSGGATQSATRKWNHRSTLIEGSALQSMFDGARLLRLDPGALRQSSGLIPFDQATAFFDDRGYGLPGVYQAIQGRGDDAFTAIRARVLELFPTLRSFGPLPISSNELVLQAELRDGTKIRAHEMSEGMLYYLAFSAIPYLTRTSLLLIEEPENGLHPARIRDVVSVLRTVVAQTGTQVVLATHSPLVVNELEPSEVTVVTRPSIEVGTQLRPIADTPNFAKRSQVYALGELWLSYADGVEEAPLLGTDPQPEPAVGRG